MIYIYILCICFEMYMSGGDFQASWIFMDRDLDSDTAVSVNWGS